jgi:IS5 family transposase
MDPALRRIDELLNDDALIDGVLEAMRGRFEHSGRRGRYGTPAEVALRLLVLKHLKSWSYEQLEWEVTGNLVYRHFCRIDGGKVPDAKTMVRLGQLLDSEVLRAVFDRVVALAARRKVTRGRKLRVDTTSSKHRYVIPATHASARTLPKCSAARSSVRGPRG